MSTVLAPDISTWPDNNFQLIGSRCDSCEAVVFPAQQHCPRCSVAMSEVLLPRRGTVVSWTTQGFRPGPPYAGSDDAASFTPFSIGLIQLGEMIRVEARLIETDIDRITFGMTVELDMAPVATDTNGDEVLMFAFRPVATEEVVP